MDSGLTTRQATAALGVFGFNEIPVKKSGLRVRIGKHVMSPISVMLCAASGLSFVLAKAFDGYFIVFLLILNIAVTVWQERKADTAIAHLNAHLKEAVRVLRDGVWTRIDSRMLVPGDRIAVGVGDVIPADGVLAEGNHVAVNESVLTGESLPKEKHIGDPLYSGSFLSAGAGEMRIRATGAQTAFGKTVFSVERIRKTSLLERDILSIAKFLTAVSIAAVIVLTAVLLVRHAPFFELLTLDLSLVIAGIPVSLPTVMTLIIEFGVLSLVGKGVVVRRLSALEDLSNVTHLLTDKTGTLTKNSVSVQDVYAYDGFTHTDVLVYGTMMAKAQSGDPIDRAIAEYADQRGIAAPAVTVLDAVPADSGRKRATLVARRNGKPVVLTVGAPQVVARFTAFTRDGRATFDRDVDALAASGFRTVAVALGHGIREEHLTMVGLIALSDTVRSEAKGVINFLRDNGIAVTMVTGDNRAIAAEVARSLGIDRWKAEILPADKLRLVEEAKKHHVVAVTGDGVNDLPAVKAAQVGIAVANAVSALKAGADIVLLTSGIQVIRDAIMESRKIFMRLSTYALYRISESLRLIVTITLLGVLSGTYPLTPLQIILLALLNDIPIISLAWDRVRVAHRPAVIDPVRRFTLSSLYGLVGIGNSVAFYALISMLWHLPWPVVQTMFFLKLTVSGHMLLYVAHTGERWYRFLPSRAVVAATTVTQLAATALALTGFLMSGRISLGQAVFVWLWALFFMQVSEGVKYIQRHIQKEGT